MPTVEIYTKPFCGYSTRAVKLLKDKGVDLIEHEAGFDPDKRDEMAARTGGPRTVPQIFIGETYVGGHDELMELEKTGELDRLLAGERP